MQSIPLTLTSHQAETITALLKNASMALKDAASISPIHDITRDTTAGDIELFFKELGIEYR